MNSLERTVCFGSFFEWTEAGREYLVRIFKEKCLDLTNVPFVGYDTIHHTFSIKTDDQQLVNLFGQLFNSIIVLYQKQKFNDNFEPLLIPIPYTSLPTVLGSSYHLPRRPSITHSEEPLIDTTQSDGRTNGFRPDYGLDGENLINYDDDSDDSTQNPSSGEAPASYWLPKCGDISILPRETADAIATSTDCILGLEPESRRVRILSGDIQGALDKLQRMEPLLASLAGHSSGQHYSVNHNLLLLSSQLPGTAVVFEPVMTEHHARRVMVPAVMEKHLEHMFVSEERLWDEKKRGYILPENLVTAQSQTRQESGIGASNLWNGFTMPSIGDSTNVIPRLLVGSSLVSMGKSKSDGLHMIAEPNKFLPRQDQARLAEWSRNIDPRADPELAAERPREPEPGSDSEELGLKTQRCVYDSDSAAGVQGELQPTFTRLVAADSDDDSEILPSKQGNQPIRPQAQQSQATNVSIQPEVVHRAPTSRANRPREPPPLVQFERAKVAVSNVVGTDVFFAGIPRDEDQMVDANDQPDASRTLEQPTAARAAPHTPTRNSKPRRGFGFDGTTDFPEDPHKEALQPMKADSITEVAQSTPKNLSSDQDRRSEPYFPSSDFDPSRYGGNNHKTRQHVDFTEGDSKQGDLGEGASTAPPAKDSREASRRLRTFPSQHHTSHAQQQADPVSIWPRPGQSSRTSVEQRRRETQESNNQLVDIAADRDTDIQSNTMPPPGFNTRPPSTPSIAHDLHILDSPLDEIQRPAIKPTYDEPNYQSEDTSFSASNSSGVARRPVFDYTPQTTIVKPDINSMRNGMVQQLLAAKQKEKKLVVKRESKSEKKESIEEDDEVSTRKFHNTMNLTAPNPGKSKKQKNPSTQGKSSGETAAQKKERIAKALADAHAPVPTSKSVNLQEEKASSAERGASPRPSDNAYVGANSDKPLSQRVQQAAKTNSFLAATHSDSLRARMMRHQADRLATYMSPFFEAARAFSGELEFCIEIGQLLVVSSSSSIRAKKAYESDKWARIFDGASTAPDVRFTSIVTSNGYDIDNIVRKVALKAHSSPAEVALDFHCQDKTGVQFTLSFETNGSHSLTKGSSVIGKVAVHCPGRVWDACAVLGGILKWHQVPDEIEQAAKQLVATIRIEPGPDVKLSFRVPPDNMFTVQNIVLRRICLRDLKLSDGDTVQLKIKETKTLYTTSHKVDKQLHKSVEQDHEVMVSDNRVHYELSIIQSELNNVLKMNRELEIGELTPDGITGAALFNSAMARTLLRSVLDVVDKMDYIGKQNYGTLQRLNDNYLARQQEIARTLPLPSVAPSLVRPVLPPTDHSRTGPRTVTGWNNVASNMRGPQSPQIIHGIRSRTAAQYYQDDAGIYRLGMGGARIPVVPEEDNGPGREVHPFDSASNAGKPAPSSASRGAYQDKPSGFW